MPKPTEFHAAMARALEGISPKLVTLDETGSTNDDARALARDGAPHLSVVTADSQTAGRGRLDRTWTAEPGAALLASVVLRPATPVDRWTTIPLCVGVVVAEAVRARTGVPAVLKWPNDVLVDERKLGGILVEAEPPSFAVVGFGINVNQTGFGGDLVAVATSLAMHGAIRLDRADLLATVVARLDDALRDEASTMERYRSLCETIGRRVRIERAAAEPLEGAAREVDPSGALVVDADVGTLSVPAGDVKHLR
jgi:BirA family biotin operon repressor/biotin-[acetyl-CoA-carboxylase] ligase